MEGDRPAERRAGGEGGLKGKDVSNEALLVAGAGKGESSLVGGGGSLRGRRRGGHSIDGGTGTGAGAERDAAPGSDGRGDNCIARRGPAGGGRPELSHANLRAVPGGENKTHYELPEPLRSGDVDLSAHGGGGARDRIRERLASILDRGPLALTADSDAAAADAHSLHGWAAYLSMVALLAGSPSCMDAERYANAVARFCVNYPQANGMMFPIELGNLLEWLVDDLPSEDDPDIVGPACFLAPDHRYWELVSEVAALFIASLDVGPNRYSQVTLHTQIARGVLGPE